MAKKSKRVTLYTRQGTKVTVSEKQAERLKKGAYTSTKPKSA